jgi:hypothetical protein
MKGTSSIAKELLASQKTLCPIESARALIILLSLWLNAGAIPPLPIYLHVAVLSKFKDVFYTTQ